MTDVKFQQINLNDNDIVGHFCEYLQLGSSLLYLELSGCHLQAKHLMLIAEQLVENTTLRVLDLSGNGTSDLVDENHICQALFLQSLRKFIAGNDELYSLNLQGLLLGKKLLFLIDTIKGSKSLLQVNLTHNLFNKYDEAYIFEQLGILPK